jgi:hypothetical protein
VFVAAEYRACPAFACDAFECVGADFFGEEQWMPLGLGRLNLCNKVRQ